MARPRKQTVDYFPHSCIGGKTLFILQNKFQNNGYAFWFKLLELLGISEGHFYDYNSPSAWQFLLAKTAVDEDTANNILATLVDLDAIDRDLAGNKIIWVQNFVNNVADVYNRRQTKLPQRPGSQPQPAQDTTLTQYLEELRPQFADLDFDNEVKKFHLYWSEGTRKLKRPKLALLNWMNKARSIKKDGAYKGRVGQPRKPEEYTDPEELRRNANR